MEYFLSDLSDLLQAGIDIDTALSALSSQAIKRGSFAIVLQEKVRQGQSLASGFSLLFFPDIIVRILRLGEWTGDLANALKKAAHYLETKRLRRERLWRILAYPLVLTILCFAVTQLLASIVLPEFYHMYQSLGVSLSKLTEFLFYLGRVIAWGLPRALIALIVLCIVLVVLYRRNGANMSYFPFSHGPLRKWLTLLEAKQSMEVLSFLLQSGLDLLTSLTYMAEMDSAGLAREWGLVVYDVSLGMSFSEVLKNRTTLPQLVIDTLEMAEKTGDLPGSTHRLSSYYTRTVDQKMERFFRTLEPLSTAILGVIIGFATLLFMLPMMNLIRQLS